VTRGGTVAAGLSGVLAAGLAIGIGGLVAAAVRPSAAPVIAVGGAAIDRTPRAVKEFAMREFGENDKRVLLAGIVVVLALPTGAAPSAWAGTVAG
jgi:hypothetical protein